MSGDARDIHTLHSSANVVYSANSENGNLDTVPLSLPRQAVALHSIKTLMESHAIPPISDQELGHIQRLGDRLVRDGAANVLHRWHRWHLNESEYQHILLLPPVDCLSLEEKCVTYYALLIKNFSNETNRGPESVARRLAQILFHIFFDEFVRELEEKERTREICIDRRGRHITTVARDFILDKIYPNEYSKLKDGKDGKKSYRDKVSDQASHGRRWWRFGNGTSLGAVLNCPRDVAINMYVILCRGVAVPTVDTHVHSDNRSGLKDGQLDVFINYVRNAYPGAIALFRSFEPVTQCLLSNKGFSYQLAMDDIHVRLSQLTRVGLCINFVQEDWRWIDTRSIAASAAADFLLCSNRSSSQRPDGCRQPS